MDDEDTQSYSTIDAQLSPLSPGSAATATDTDHTMLYEQRPEASESESQPTTDDIVVIDETELGPDMHGRPFATTAPDFRRLALQRPMSRLMEQSLLAAYCEMAQIPTWSILDAGVHEYFQQHLHCAAERTELYDQISAEVRGLDAQHTIAFFHNFLEDEHLQYFYAELYRLLYWALRDTPGIITADFPYDAVGARANDAHRPQASGIYTDGTPGGPAVIDVLDSSASDNDNDGAQAED